MSKKHRNNSQHIYSNYDLKELFIETDELFFMFFLGRHNYSPFLLMEKQYTLLMSLLVKAPT